MPSYRVSYVHAAMTAGKLVRKKKCERVREVIRHFVPSKWQNAYYLVTGLTVCIVYVSNSCNYLKNEAIYTMSFERYRLLISNHVHDASIPMMTSKDHLQSFVRQHDVPNTSSMMQTMQISITIDKFRNVAYGLRVYASLPSVTIYNAFAVSCNVSFSCCLYWLVNTIQP